MRKYRRDSIVNYFTNFADYYNTIYDKKSEKRFFRALEMQWRKIEVLKILDTFSQEQSLKVLDIGCGVGHYLKSMFERGHKAFGMDITSEMISKACSMNAEYCKNGKPIMQGDIESLPFPDHTFDVILCVGVLQYLQTDQMALKEISRVIKSNGIAIVTAPNYFKLGNILDPFYYFNLAPKYFWRRCIRKKNSGKSGGCFDFSRNTDFSNRRYYYGQLDSQFESNNLVKIKVANVGFGPFTFCRKELFPLSCSEDISHFFKKLVCKRYFEKLKYFANRWVFCLQKRNL